MEKMKNENKTEMKQKSKKNPVNIIIDTISAIFLPILNVLTAAGVTKGILALLVSLKVIGAESDSYLIINAFADALFYFLPVFVAFTSAKQFQCDEFTAVVIACALVYPTITARFELGEKLDFFGLSAANVKYPTSVIPVLMAIGLLHYIERIFKRIIPKALAGFFVPLVSVLIVGSVTLLVFGPIGSWAGNGLAGAYTAIYQWNPFVSGFVIGGLIQIMVIFGFHWSIVPIIISNIAVYGYDTILPFLGPAVFAQAGAAFAVFFKTKNKAAKEKILPAVLSSILGVTEPTMFGVNLPLKKPMIGVCVGGAIGGMLVGATKAHAIAFAFPGVPTFPVYFGQGFWGFVGCMILGGVIGFLVTIVQKIDVSMLEEVKESE